jgi:hypothetical protein
MRKKSDPRRDPDDPPRRRASSADEGPTRTIDLRSGAGSVGNPDGSASRFAPTRRKRLQDLFTATLRLRANPVSGFRGEISYLEIEGRGGVLPFAPLSCIFSDAPGTQPTPKRARTDVAERLNVNA